MKLFYSLLIFAFAPLFSFGQCGVTINSINVYCYGSSNGSATASATGTSPFTYMWTPTSQTTQTINGLSVGTYTVTMTDNVGCIATATVNISSPPQLTQTMTVVSPSCGSCCNGSATAIMSGGVGPYTYQWMPSGGTASSAFNLCAGTYTCCVIDANGCATCSSNCPFCETSVTLSPATGLNETVSNSGINVYPTPANEFVTVKETFANPISAVISISNVLGETVYTKSVSGTSELNETINVAEYTAGVYFISVKTATGISVRRFVKE